MKRIAFALLAALPLFALAKAPCDDGSKLNHEGAGEMVSSYDPNDIIGPEGKGVQRYVSRGERLAYTIDFENVSNATASAQMIRVTLPKDPNLDWTTLQLDTIAMGHDTDSNLVGKRPGAAALESTGLTSDNGYMVKTSVTEENGNLVWVMRIWDDTTEDNFPDDALAGILPPNNPETHCGEGYVKYSVCVKTNAAQNAVITAKGTIVFDTNAPIDTDPWWKNTVGLDITVEPFADDIGYMGYYDGELHGIDVIVREPTEGTTVKYCATENGEYTTTPVTYRDVGTNTVYFTVEKEGYVPYSGFAYVIIKSVDDSAEITMEPGETSQVFSTEAAATNVAAHARVAFPADLADSISQQDRDRYTGLFRIVTKSVPGGWQNSVEFTPAAEQELKQSLDNALKTFDLSRITIEDTNWVVPNPVKGLYYALERTEDLASGFNVNAYKEATSVSITFTVNETGNAAGRAFYRLIISACPPVE